MYSSKTYLKTYFYLGFWTCLLIILSNLIIDPQAIFRLVEIEKINSQKPLINQSGLRKLKSIEIERGDYNTIILGTSRVAHGLHPLSFQLSDKVYNAGLDGSNMYEISQVFHFSRHVQPLKSVILGLDFASFSGNNRVRGDFELSRFAGKSKYEIYFASLFSSQQLVNSWETLQFNRKGNELNTVYTIQGFRKRKSFPAFNKKHFQRKLRMNFERYQQLEYQKSKLKLFEEIVTYCLKNNIQLHLFISPIHVQNLEVMRIAGRFSTFEQWKKDLVRVVDNANNNHKYQNKVNLWDFTGYNTITTEYIPTVSQEDSLKGYIDSDHYRPKVGNLIIELVVNGNSRKKAKIPEDFGVVINKNNIEQHLQKVRFDQQLYHQDYPEVIEEIEKVFQ